MIQSSEHWLFVCSANYIRSPTAEYVARKRGLLASSCGTSRFPDFVVIPITPQLVGWADVVVCMEPEHVVKVKRYAFPGERRKRVFCWNLPDDFKKAYDDSLVRIIESKLTDTIAAHIAGVTLEEAGKAGRRTDDAASGVTQEDA